MLMLQVTFSLLYYTKWRSTFGCIDLWLHSNIINRLPSGVLAAVKKAFADLQGGFPNWLHKLVCLGSDGASVNLGVRNGVVALIKEEAGNHVIPFHCMAHR